MGVGRRVQNGKVVDPGSSPISCGQAKSLSHSQFPQLYNEFLGPLWLPCAAFLTGRLLGMLVPSVVETQRKVSVRRRQTGPPLSRPGGASCTWEI